MPHIDLTFDPYTQNTNSFILKLKTTRAEIDSIGLTINASHYNATEDLGDFLAALPPRITSVSLDNNNFNMIDPDELANALKKTPETVTSISLRETGLASFYYRCFENIVKALPKNATTVDLSKNNLGRLPPNDLRQAFKAFPVNLKVIKLQECFIANGYNLVALDSLPDGLESIDLSNNPLFHLCDTNTLASTLKTIKSKVTSLDLSKTELHKLTFTDLATVISAIPATVDVTKLDRNQLSSAGNLDELKKIVNLNHSTQVFLSMLDTRIDKLDNEDPSKTTLRALADHVRTNLSQKQHIPSFNNALYATFEFLNDTTKERKEKYDALAYTLEGSPSTVLKALGVIMLALATAAVVALVFCPPSLVVAGGGLAAAIGAVAGYTFFEKGCTARGLSKLVGDIADASNVARQP